MSTKRYTSYGSNKWGIVDGELSTYEDRYTEKSTGSKLVSAVGLIIITAILIFAFKWFAGAALAAGVVYPRKELDAYEAEENSDKNFAVLVIFPLVLVALVFSFILA
jgi:hypothetical protein